MMALAGGPGVLRALLPSREGWESGTHGSLIQLSDGRMTSILRSPQALQLTLALIKPDAVAHPLILEVRTNQSTCFRCRIGICGDYQLSAKPNAAEVKLRAMNCDPKETKNLLETWDRSKMQERTQHHNKKKIARKFRNILIFYCYITDYHTA